MAHLKVTFPHDDVTGKRLEAGDVIQVEDRLVDFYLQPHPYLNMVVYAHTHHAHIANASSVEAPAKLPAFGDAPDGQGPIGGVFSPSARAPKAPQSVMLDGVSVEAANDTEAVRAANEEMARMAAASIDAQAVPPAPEEAPKPSDAEVAATEKKAAPKKAAK